MVNTTRILEDAESFKGPDSLPADIETIFRRSNHAGFAPDLVTQGRSAVGMAVSAMSEIDLDLKPEELERRCQLAKLMDPDVAVLASFMPERLFRPNDPHQQYLALMEILSGVGVPEDLSFYEKAGLITASSPLLAMLPSEAVELVMRYARNHILRQVGGFVEVFEDFHPWLVVPHLERCAKRTGVGYELNLVTESARTEGEARKNIEWYKSVLRSRARKVAIKPTSLAAFSDNSIASPSSRNKLVQALCEIFDTANMYRLNDEDGGTAIITIDSERSDILGMIRDAVIEAASEFPRVRVQIAMQAYLHDTESRLLNPMLQASTNRVLYRGGEPLGARLVNGANKEGEEQFASVTGSLHGTPLVSSRAEAHANFRRLRRKMIDPLKDGTFTLTIGTMNMITLMDSLLVLARAGVFAGKNGGLVHFSMLKGMTGQEVFRFLQKKYGVSGHEYVPVISLTHIVELFKYYLRRIEELASKLGKIDENCVANYLGVTARYGIDSPEWAQTQVWDGVVASLMEYQKRGDVCLDPKIRGYRGEFEPLVAPESIDGFRPVPSMAPGSYEDSAWIDEAVAQCVAMRDGPRRDELIRISFKGEDEEVTDVQFLSGPTCPDLELKVFELSDRADIDRAFEIAHEDPARWGKKSMTDKLDILKSAVIVMRDKRALLVKSLMMNIGKSVLEADEEVSEAMDFLNLARLHMRELCKRDNLEFEPDGDGVATVICPKNFPQAIPIAHIVARLMAGYRVIVKPSGGEEEESVWATYEIINCLWEAGVPKEALIFLPCDNKTAPYLAAKSQRVGFTGSTDTAKKICSVDPSLDLLAETGGRNFIVVDSTTDLKVAATEILKSFCGFAGQKCSKPRGVILTKDVDMESFKRHLLGQLQEMVVGTALLRHVDVTPLSRQYEPAHPFYKRVMECAPGEEWLSCEIPTGVTGADGRKVMKQVSARPINPGDPGVRIVTDPGNFDFTQMEEIFAPIITVMQIDGGVEEAIAIVNGMRGNLTGSLFSQNRAAITYALENWETGNLYVNRGCTGAKAHQGFGDGVGDSHLGAHGAKTGTVEWQIINSGIRRKPGKYAQYDKTKIAGYNEGIDDTGLVYALTYLQQMMVNIPEAGLRDELTAAIHAGWSYLYEYSTYFRERRPVLYQVKGQYDWIESQNVGRVLFRIDQSDSVETILCKIFATVAARNHLRVSVPPHMSADILRLEGFLGGRLTDLFPNIEVIYEHENGLVDFVNKNDDIGCILYNKRSRISKTVARACARNSLYIDCRPPTGDGKVDMMTQFRQQSYCWVYHIAGDTSYERMMQEKHPELCP